MLSTNISVSKTFFKDCKVFYPSLTNQIIIEHIGSFFNSLTPDCSIYASKPKNAPDLNCNSVGSVFDSFEMLNSVYRAHMLGVQQSYIVCVKHSALQRHMVAVIDRHYIPGYLPSE